MIKVAILTLSDKGSKGEREDITGKKLEELLSKDKDYILVKYKLIADELELIKKTLKEFANENIDLILTNGGTGFSKRDVTPEATKSVIEKEVPGVAEYMRLKSMQITPKAMLSRGYCGILKNSVILNLPGSPKGATENFSFVMDTIKHGIEILKGEAKECAEPIEVKNEI